MEESPIFRLFGFHHGKLHSGDLEVLQRYLAVDFVDLRLRRKPHDSVFGRLVGLTSDRDRGIRTNLVAFPSLHLWLVHRDRFVSVRHLARPWLVKALHTDQTLRLGMLVLSKDSRGSIRQRRLRLRVIRQRRLRSAEKKKEYDRQ